MIQLFENTPYRRDKDLVKAYNSFMELLPDDGWALFRDADTLFLDSFYGETILKAIEDNPDTDCFTCLTNRIGCPIQKHSEYKGDDIIKHREIANKLKSVKPEYINFPKDSTLMSGMLFVLSKKAWDKIGGLKKHPNVNNNILGVDNKLHLDLLKNKFKIKVIKNLYIYHWYRGGNMSDTKHLL